MIHAVLLGRLPVAAVGAVVGGWAAGTVYLIVMWRLFEWRNDQIDAVELPE